MGGGGYAARFLFCSLFPVQQTTSGIGHRVKQFFRVGNQYAECENDSFNDWGGGQGCNKFVPDLGGNGTKIAPAGDIFDQPRGQMR